MRTGVGICGSCMAIRGSTLPAAEWAVRDLLVALGRDPSSPHLADTPLRVGKSFTEMLTPREFDLTTFPNDEHYDELVLARSIPVQSLCEHHMLPFTGVAHVGYLPGERILDPFGVTGVPGVLRALNLLRG